MCTKTGSQLSAEFTQTESLEPESDNNPGTSAKITPKSKPADKSPKSKLLNLLISRKQKI